MFINTGRPHFTVLLRFIALHKYCGFFLQMKLCGNPASSKSVSAIFPAAFAYFVSLCHILVILRILHTFSLLGL